MGNQRYRPLFGSFDEAVTTKGPASQQLREQLPYVANSPEADGDSSLVNHIPASLVVTGAAFREFMCKNRLDEVVEGLLMRVNVKSLEELRSPASQIQEIIQSSPLPEVVCDHLLEGCQRIGDGPAVVWPVTMPFELVRLSRQCQRPSYLEASGAPEIIQAIRVWWASLFEATAIFYRELNRQRHWDARITVAVQRLLPPAANGAA